MENTMRHLNFSALTSIAFTLLLIQGCAEDDFSHDHCQLSLAGEIMAVSSLEQLNQTLTCLVDVSIKREEGQGGPRIPVEAYSSDFTNNQEAKADEGGLVKNVGNLLVTLRHGVLFAIRTADEADASVTDVIRVAPSPELNQGVWFDELLTYENQVYVVGYRYRSVPLADNQKTKSATEISTFFLENGQFRRGEILSIESPDYYRPTNYVARMIDGRLNLQLTLPAIQGKGAESTPNIPGLVRTRGGERFNELLIKPNHIFATRFNQLSPVLHLILNCQMGEAENLSCESKTLLGDVASSQYVSESRNYFTIGKSIFSLNFSDGTFSKHRIEGNVANQYAYLETENSLLLNVTEEGITKILTLPLADFNLAGDQALNNQKEVLSPEERRTGNNTPSWGSSGDYGYYSSQFHLQRFIGGYLVLTKENRLTTMLLETGEVKHFEIIGSITRIEPMSASTAMIFTKVEGQSAIDLPAQIRLDVLDLSGSPKIVSSLAFDIELADPRTHSFLYRGDSNSGLLGIVTGEASTSGYVSTRKTPGITFVRFERETGLSFAGELTPPPRTSGSLCETSCSSWYGNSRPIFLGEKIFGLLGENLQEVAFTEGELSERGEAIDLGTARERVRY